MMELRTVACIGISEAGLVESHLPGDGVRHSQLMSREILIIRFRRKKFPLKVAMLECYPCYEREICKHKAGNGSVRNKCSGIK